MEKNGMLTLGTDSKDVDWESMWRQELAKDDIPAKEGVASYKVPHSFKLHTDTLLISTYFVSCSDG
jgi:hypothetical protein